MAADEASSSIRPPRARIGNLGEIALQFGFTLLGRGSYLALQVLLARVLGPESFGLYAIGWTVAGLANTLAPIGMPHAVLRYGIGGRAALVSAPAIVVVLAGGACMMVLLLAPGLIATRVFGEPAAIPIIRAFAPSIPLLGLATVVWSALRVSGRILYYATTGAGLFVVHLLLTIIVFALRPSAIAAAQTYTLAVGLTLLASIPLLWRVPGQVLQQPSRRQLMHFGFVTMLITGSAVLNLWADRVVIGIMAPPRVLGAYQVASQFAMIMVVLRSAVTSVFENRVPKYRSGAPLPDVTREFVAATRLLLHVSVPGLIVLACSSNFWVHLLFGAPYAAAAAPLVVLVIGQIVSTFAGPSPTALHMTGEERSVMWLMIGATVLNIVGNVVLIPSLGAIGAATATGIANVAVTLACLLRLSRTGRLRFSITWLRDIVLASSLCTALALLTTSFGSMSVSLALTTVLAAYLLYGLCICLTCTVEDELAQQARSLSRRALGRIRMLSIGTIVR